MVIWSGDPLENASVAEAVWIDGVRQPLDNHQTKLRDRYRSLERRALPDWRGEDVVASRETPPEITPPLTPRSAEM